MATRPVRVLLVDDEPDMLFLLKAILQGPQWEIVGLAADGAQAIRMLDGIEPDIAVIDYMMPGMNGLDVAEAIKRAAPSCTTVIFSAYPAIGPSALANSAIDAFLEKDQVTRIDELLTELVEARDGHP